MMLSLKYFCVCKIWDWHKLKIFQDVCISAVKEKDIEAKLKQVINDWSAQDFQFSAFKTRGELLLKGMLVCL